MNKDRRFSDEFLNAFVDNQLTPDEKSRAYAEISQDEELNRHVCELRKVHDLVQLAYRDVPAAPVPATASVARRQLRFGAVAAAVVLATGIALGIQLNLPVALKERAADETRATVAPVSVVSTPRGAAPQHRAAHRPATPRPVVLPAADGPEPERIAVAIDTPAVPAASAPRSINDVQIGNVRNKVLIHVANDDPARLAQALEEIEGLMRYYRETGQSAHVEVVINGRGLELVRVDTSAHAASIARLQREYKNLTFAACQNTIDRLKREQGITARLLPGVVVTDSGMAEIMRRQHQGWTYLQV
jgi:intracellular sulfur oxidation DsrE/DsrF family protein